VSYYTVNKIGNGKYKNRGSKFFSYLHPMTSIEEYRHLIAVYRKNFPEACHVCSAYRLIIGSRIDEYGTDDGEPKGTAGLPILNQLKRNELVNTGVYVVRIFGGSLLGVPGLIESYSTAALFAIDSIEKIKYTQKKILSITVSYDYNRILESLIEEFNGNIIKQNFSNIIEMEINLDNEHVSSFIKKLSDSSSNKAIVEIL